MKIFCLPYAGGNSSFYNNKMNLLKEHGIEIVTLDYAGHGERIKEKYYEHFIDMVHDMALCIEGCVKESEEYALFGYSMGGIVAVYILDYMIEHYPGKVPTNIFVASHGPIEKDGNTKQFAELSDSEVKRRTIEFGGVSEKLLDNSVYWRMYLPLYKNDYRLMEDIDFDKLSLQTTVPAVFFYSKADPICKNMKLWDKYFYGKTSYYEYEGNHFFIEENWEAVTDIIINTLNR